MIVARRTPPAEMASRHERVQAAMREMERERPELANIGPALEAWDPSPLDFRGRRVPARPIAWEDGLRLLEAAADLERWAEGGGRDLAALRALYRRTVDLCWIALRPRWMPRWLQRMRPNPFRRATETELGEILDFAARCRTISLVGRRS